MCEDVNLWIFDGEVVGQEVLHVHYIVPRLRGDSLSIKYKAEPWHESKRSQLDEIAIAIQQHL